MEAQGKGGDIPGDVTLDGGGAKIVYYLTIPSGSGLSTDCPNGEEEKVKS
jgi:hypothetical protein